MIAVLEDNETDIAIYKATILKDMEYESFTSLQDFLNEHRSYELAIVDLNLPDAFGTEVIRSTKKQADKIIVITGTGDKYLTGKNYMQFMEAGASEVFKKTLLTDEVYIEMIRKEIND